MLDRIEPEMLPLAELFRAAAAMLTGQVPPEGPPAALLARLEYLDGATALAPHRAALLNAAAGFRRVFTLEAADAPGLVVLGAEVSPAGIADAPVAGVSGTALTFRQAFERCVGEGVELLSQYPAPDDPIEALTEAEALDGAGPALRRLWDRLSAYRRAGSAPRTAWIAAADLASGRPARLPVDVCLRRPRTAREIDPPWPLSTGCGAGPDHLSATLHGLLELIERDAIALWWRGGRRARLVPGEAGAALLAQLRRGESARRTWLLDVTSDVGVPVVVAASCHDDGFGLCCGFAAGLTLADAAESALREMAQMELAWRLTETKRAVRGEVALNDRDRQHRYRFAVIDVGKTPALHPLAPPAPPRDLPTDDPLHALGALRQRLAAVGLAPCALNLTRTAFGIPVVRVVCPGLEPGMSAPPGPRLHAACAETGADPDRAEPLL